MNEKVEQALDMVRQCIASNQRVAVLWSGGKDSTVLLHLARQVTREIDVIFWRAPHFPDKYVFVNELIPKWNLRVWDFPPMAISLSLGAAPGQASRIDVMEEYHIGGGQRLTLARGTEREIEGEPFLCGVKDWVMRPKGSMEFPWTALLHGHKSVDIDPLSGPVPLNVDVQATDGGAAAYFPLRHWTDEDVWEYTTTNGLPWDMLRYQYKDGQFSTRKNKRLNNDYFHSCFRCIDPREGKTVRCPKLGIEMENKAHEVPWIEPKMSYCNLRTSPNEETEHAV